VECTKVERDGHSKRLGLSRLVVIQTSHFSTECLMVAGCCLLSRPAPAGLRTKRVDTYRLVPALLPLARRSPVPFK